MNSDIEVRESNIEGRGLFAKRPFKKGELVLVWDVTHILTGTAFQALPKEERRYVAKLGNTLILMQPPARYINHSCNPNTNPSQLGQDIAIRDIEQGEEITSDYAVDGATGEKMKCNCGSENCLGTIIA